MILTLAKDDPKVTEFREKVYTDDLKLDLKYMDYTYTQLKNEMFDVLGVENFENAWKMSNTKFKQEEIDIVCLMPKFLVVNPSTFSR